MKAQPNSAVRCYENKHLPGDWIVAVGEEYTATFSGLEAGQRAHEYQGYLMNQAWPVTPTLPNAPQD